MSEPGQETAAEILAMAEEVMAKPAEAGLCLRAASLLGRQAIERALQEFWRDRGLTFDAQGSRHQQFICLRGYVAPVSAAQLQGAWTRLTWACHHRSFDGGWSDAELARELGELRSWLVTK